jgi:hypothetical protein
MPYAVPEEPTYAAKAENIVKSNPDLIQEPSAVHALASTPGVDGQTLGQVSAFANHIGNIKEAIDGHANSSPEGHGFWSDVTNFVHTLGKDISGIPALLDPSLFSGMPAEQRTGYQNAVVSGYNSVAHGTLNALERAASTATEAATGGFLGPKGVGAFSANQADLEQTFKNLVNVPKNWRLGKTAMAYIDSLRNKKGDLYAMYYTLPSVIAAVSGDEVIAGGGAAKDAETMAALAAKINAGEGDAETIARFMAASSRSARKFSAQNLPEDAAASTLEDSAKAEKPSSFVGKGTADKAISAFNRGKDFFQTASRWTLGPLAKAGKGYLKAVSDPRLFGTYVSLQQQAMQDPMTRALWQAAEQGIVLDSRGMPMNITPGQSLANSIGLYRGDFGYNLVSGAADLGAFISSDPFSPAFNVLDAANSAQGVGGILGKWWTGLGVETGADVERLAGSNVRNRRAFEYMATHSESEIRKMFKGMYSDNLFQQLGRAKTWDQVVAIHADIADGAALTGYVLPTTKVMRLGLRAIAEGLGKVIDAGKSITGRGIPSTDFIQAIEIMNDELVKAGFEPIATDAVTQAETSELAALARGSIRRKIDALSTEAIWKINEAEKLGEVPSISNYAFRLNDKSAIPLIQRQFLITGQFNHRIIEALGQVLSAAKTETEFGNALVNLSTVAVSGQLGRMVGEKYWALRDMFESMIRSDFENFYGFRGGGAFKARRIFNNGPEGEAMSTFVDPTDPTRIGMYGNTWEHIRQGRFVDPREIKGMLSRYAAAAKAADDTVVNRVAEARMMDESALERVAQYKNAVVKDARTEMGDQAAARTEGYFKNGQTQEMMGYRDGFERVSAMANRVLGDASLSEAQRYVEYAKGVSNAVTRAAETLTTATEKADQYAAAKEAADNASKLNLPKARQLNENLRGMFTVPPEQLAQMRGELQALMDMEYKVYGKIQEYGVTAKDFNQLTEALGLGNATEEERAAKQALVDKMRKYRSENISFLSGRNKLADGLNKALSWTFIPAALSTAAYLTRVAASEAFVNISRMGVATYIEARLAASIVKHESNYVPLQSVKNILNASETKDVSEVELLTKESMRLANILMDTAKTTKAFMIGALTGTERGILEGMNPERFERMLADFAMFLKSTNGHLADVGHGVNQLYGTSREVAAMSEMAYGVDKNGDKAISGTRMVGQGFTRADKSHIASALSKQLRLINQSSMYNPIARDIEDMVVRNGTTYSGAEADRAFEMLLDKQVNRLKSMPEGELEAFGANGKLLASGSTGDPLRDFAKSQVYNVWHTLSGLRPVLGVGQESIFHPELIDQAISGLVKSEPELAKDYVAAKGMYPMHVIASADARETWETTGARKFIRIFRTALELPRTLNEVVLDRHFGHLISWISREPVFLWEAHVAMEEARQMVADNLMTHDQAIVQALNRGFTRMVKYVHNPADRFAFEQYTRMYSPFWFAKNQSYRRAFRLLEEDPAAFVKYMRINLRATQYCQNIQNKNQSYVVLPGGTEISQTAVNIAAGGNDMLGAFFNNIGFSTFGDPTSVQTVDPLGCNTGGRMVENILRPDPGPYVSVVTKLLTKTLAEHHVIDPIAHADALRWLLGPINSQTGILSDIYPSSFWRNTAVLIGDVIATNAFGGNVTFDYVAQTQTEAIHEAMTNMLSIYIDEYKAINNITKPTDQQNLDALHYAEQQMSVWFNEGNHRQDFINRAHTAALGLSAAKLLTSFFLPIAPVLRAKFATSDFNKYVNQKMPDGSPIPYSEAVYQFALKEPQNFLDTISGSQSPYGPFPETKVFLKWSNDAPNLLNPNNGYPNFLAYAIPRQGGYLPGVFQTQVSMGLRKADTPQEYTDTVLTQLGNDFYYGQLLPQYYTEYGAYYGPNDPRNTISYEGYKQLKTAAQNWGNYNNPTWLQFGSPFGTLARPKEIKAIQQLQSFLNDTPAQQQVVRDGLFTQDNINTLRVALSIYNQRIKEIQAITSSSGKWSVEQELSSLMNGIAANPDNKNIAYFLTEVLAKAPTK